MPHLRIMLITLFPLAFLASCDDEVDPVFIEIPGKLKKELYFAAVNAEHPERFTEYKYGENGKVLEESFNEYPDHQYYFIRKEYDSKERLVKQTSYTNESGKFMKGSYRVFEYNEQDRLIREASYYEGQLNGEVVYEYDQQGRKVKESFFRPEHDYPSSYEIFTYNEDGLPLRDSLYGYDASDKKHHLDRLYEYEYGKSGKLVKRWFTKGLRKGPEYYEQGVEEEYFYNQEGTLIESRRYDPYHSYTLMNMTRYEYY